jgi:hypothetical protein
MFDYGDEARRQLCRERAATLACDYRRAQPAPADGAAEREPSTSHVTRTLSLLGQQRRPEPAPANRT